MCEQIVHKSQDLNPEYIDVHPKKIQKIGVKNVDLLSTSFKANLPVRPRLPSMVKIHRFPLFEV